MDLNELRLRYLASAQMAQAFEGFNWADGGLSRRGRRKAVWAGPGKKDTLYGSDAEEALQYEGKGMNVARAITDVGDRVLRGAKDATIATAQGIGKGAKAAARTSWLAAKKVNQWSGQFLAWLGTKGSQLARNRIVQVAFSPLTKVLQKLDENVFAGGLSKGLFQQRNKLRNLRNRLRDNGLAYGVAHGAWKFGVPYFEKSFRVNKKKHGTVIATGIELASMATNLVLGQQFKGVATAAGVAGGAVLGSTLGMPYAGAFVGGNLGHSGASWFLKGTNAAAKWIAGKSGSSAGNSLGRTLVEFVPNKLAGVPPSPAKQRAAAGAVLELDNEGRPARTVFPKIARRAIRKGASDFETAAIAARNKAGIIEKVAATRPGEAVIKVKQKAGKAKRKVQNWLGLSEVPELEELLAEVRRNVMGQRAVHRQSRVEPTDEQLMAGIYSAGKLLNRILLPDEASSAFGENHGPWDSYAWEAARSRTGGMKAIGTGPHAGRRLYGKQAQMALNPRQRGAGKSNPKEQADSRVKPTMVSKKQFEAVNAMLGGRGARLSGDRIEVRGTSNSAKKDLLTADFKRLSSELGVEIAYVDPDIYDAAQKPATKAKPTKPAQDSDLIKEVTNLYDVVSKPEVTEEQVLKLTAKLKSTKDKGVLKNIGDSIDMKFGPKDTASGMAKKISGRLLGVKRSAMRDNAINGVRKRIADQEKAKNAAKDELSRIHASAKSKDFDMVGADRFVDGLKDGFEAGKYTRRDLSEFAQRVGMGLKWRGKSADEFIEHIRNAIRDKHTKAKPKPSSAQSAIADLAKARSAYEPYQTKGGSDAADEAARTVGKALGQLGAAIKGMKKEDLVKVAVSAFGPKAFVAFDPKTKSRSAVEGHIESLIHGQNRTLQMVHS